MPNILDFLATKTPQNYVQPLDIQPSYSDIYSGIPTQVEIAKPVVPPEPYYPSTNIASDLRNLDRLGGQAIQDIVGKSLTPTISPMQTGEIVPAINPYVANPINAPSPSGWTPNTLLKLAQNKSQYPYSGEADKAIALAGKAANDFAINAPPQAPQIVGYDQPVKRMEQSTDKLSQDIGAYEQETQNLVNQISKVNDDYIKDFEKTNQTFLTRAQDVSKRIDQAVNTPVDTTIDPQRFWSKASTGSLIALAIGSVFAAMTPQSAQAATNTIMKAIDNDIDAQKQTAANKMREKSDKVNALGDEFNRLKELTGSELAAYEVKRAQKFNFASIMLKQQADKLSNKTALNNAQNTIATLQMEAMKSQQAATNASIEHNDRLAQIQLDAKQKQAEFMLAKAKLKSDERIAGAGQGMGMALPQLSIEENIRYGAVPKEQRNEAIKEAGLARAADIMLAGADNYYDRVLADINDTGFGGGRIMQALPFTKSGTYRDLGSTLIWQPAAQLAQGAIQQHEFEALIKPFLPKTFDTVAQIETKRAGLKNSIASLMAGKMPTLATYGIDYNKQYPSINNAIISPKGKK